MDFYKTTVLPLDNVAEAQRLLTALIHDEPEVLFVVLGTTPDRERLVSRAGSFAGSMDDQRWVVWVRKLDDVRAIVGSLRERTVGFKQRVFAGAAGFTVSVGDEIRDVLAADETFDNVRVMQAFVNAEVP